MKAFVTGSTGLLGNNLVRLLVQPGHQVKGLVRSNEKAANILGDIDVTLVSGDMLVVDSFAPELDGCDVLFHTAAYFREYYQPGDHWKLLEDINVKGTINLLTEAERRGINKVVYISSAGVIGKKPSGAPGDESTPPHPLARRNLYLRSKILAEEAIFEFLKEHSLPVVLILPGWMFGPGDAAPTGSGQLVLDFLRRKLPGVVEGGMGVVDARDVAQAMINAVERGRSGERYIVGGRYYNLEEIGKTLEKITGIPAPKLHIPHAVTLLYAWLSEIYARLTGRPVLVSLEGVRNMSAKFQWVSDKAVRELGAAFRPLEETLRDEINWYRSHNYV